MEWTNAHIIDPQKHKAFVYEITNLDTGEKYIGKKQTFTRRYDHRTKKYVYKESDWCTYQSSSTIVQDWTNIKKTILHPCLTIQEATYIETSLLFKRDALSDDSPYVNRNIGGKYFRHFDYKEIPNDRPQQ